MKPQRAWQRMLSGRRLDLLDPSPLDVEIEDIAHGLARVARWNGQTIGPNSFSVAQHSLVVCRLVDLMVPEASRELRMMTLLHDAPEYVIGDMISPFKAVMGGDYRTVEERLQGAIHMRFSLPPKPTQKVKRLIKKADLAAAWFEATELAGFTHDEADAFFGRPRGVTVSDLPLEPMPTAAAQTAYRAHFDRLDGVDAEMDDVQPAARHAGRG